MYVIAFRNGYLAENMTDVTSCLDAWQFADYDVARYTGALLIAGAYWIEKI